MQMLHAIPALPVAEMARSIAFYRDKLGFGLVHHDGGFAIVQRDAVTLHLWEASDQRWRSRSTTNPVVSGAESFIAGTASCRIAVDDVDALHRELQPQGVLHPRGQLSDQPWGSREFAISDPDNNLITLCASEAPSGHTARRAQSVCATNDRTIKAAPVDAHVLAQVATQVADVLYRPHERLWMQLLQLLAAGRPCCSRRSPRSSDGRWQR